MSIFTTVPDDSQPAAPAAPVDSSSLIPDHASYLVAANAHQQAGVGNSIFDPSTWGNRADNAMKFSVSTLTRAVSSTYNAAITVGKIVGITDDSDKAKTQDWLSNMDDDLGQYYKANQSSVDTWGDVLGMFVPGTAGVKVFNLAQKGIALATEGRAGLQLAYNFGVLPTKAAKLAGQAAEDIANSNNPYSLINANLIKSFAAGLGQSYLEVAAFQVSAELSMRDSPLFKDHDMGDIAHNALMAGGFIGGGLLGGVAAVKVWSDVKKAGKAVDAATRANRTVGQEVMKGTPASEAMCIHLDNAKSMPEVDMDNPLAAKMTRDTANTQSVELDNARTAMNSMFTNDSEAGNFAFNAMSGGDSNSLAQNFAGVTGVSRAGQADVRDITVGIVKQEGKVADSAAAVSAKQDAVDNSIYGTSDHATATAELVQATSDHQSNLDNLTELRSKPVGVNYLKLVGDDAGTEYSVAPTLHLADKVDSAKEALKVVNSFGHTQSQTDFDVAVQLSKIGEDGTEARYIKAQMGDFDLTEPVGVADIPYLERGWAELGKGNAAAKTLTLSDGTQLTRSQLYHHIVQEKTTALDNLTALPGITSDAAISQATLAKLVNTSDEYVVGTHNTGDPVADMFRMQSDADKFTKGQIAQELWSDAKGTIPIWDKPSIVRCIRNTASAQNITGHVIDGMTAIKEEQALYREVADNVFT